MARNIAAGSGTLAGSPVALAGPPGTKCWAVFNDHASNVYDFVAGGVTVKVNAGECIALPYERDAATLNGTGAYRWIAFDAADAANAYLRSLEMAGTAALADESVTAAKLAAAVAGAGLTGGAGTALAVGTSAAGGLTIGANAVDIKPDVTTGATRSPILLAADGASVGVDDSTIQHTAGVLAVKDGGVTAAKLAAGAVVPAKTAGSSTRVLGSIAVPQLYVVEVADGANEFEIVVPVKSVLCMAFAAKRGGAGGAGDAIQIRTATGGGGALIASYDLAGIADMTAVLVSGIDDAQYAIAAGASLFVLGVAGAGDNSALVTLLFAPVT